MKIVVLVKQVPDTEEPRRLRADGLLDRDGPPSVLDEIDERALEVALRRKDADRSTVVEVLTMGPAGAATALRTALATGADQALHVCDDALAGADAGRTAVVLAAALRQSGADLVVAGDASTDGATGVVPAMVAEHLGLPLASALSAATVDGDGVHGERAGLHGPQRVAVGLPAVLTVTEKAAEARFANLKGILTARRKPLRTLGLVDLGLADAAPADDAGGPAPVAATAVRSVAARPPRGAGVRVVDDGTGAAQLAAFLRERDLAGPSRVATTEGAAR